MNPSGIIAETVVNTPEISCARNPGFSACLEITPALGYLCFSERILCPLRIKLGIRFVVKITLRVAVAVRVIGVLVIYNVIAFFVAFSASAEDTVIFKSKLPVKFSVLIKTVLIEASEVITREKALAICALYLPRAVQRIYIPAFASAVLMVKVCSAIHTYSHIGIIPISEVYGTRNGVICYQIIDGFNIWQIFVCLFYCGFRLCLCPVVFLYILTGSGNARRCVVR